MELTREETNGTLFQRLNKYFWPETANDYLLTPLFVNNTTLIVFRVCAFIFNIVNISLNTDVHGSPAWLLFLTHWGIIVSNITYLLFMIHLFYRPIWKIVHFLFELAWSIESNIAIIYWSFLFPINPQMEYLNFFAHLVTFMILTIDQFNNTIIFYPRHGILILIFVAVYTLFNLIYVMSSGTTIYAPLTFTNWISYVFLLCSLLIVLCSFVISYYYNRIKMRKLSKLIEYSESLNPQNL